MDGCREWRGATTEGYGQRRVKGKTVFVHRWVWERVVGPIAPGNMIHHRCGNRRCYRIAHLQEVSRKEHAALHRPVRCAQGHDAWVDRPSGRVCVICDREKLRRWRRRKVSL